MGGEAVSEGMTRGLLVDACPAHGVVHNTMDILPVQVVPPNLAVARVTRVFHGNKNLTITKIKVPLAQPERLHNPHSGTVEQARHEPVDTVHETQNRRHLVRHQDLRQPGRSFGADHILQPRQFLMQHLLV